MSIYQSIVVVQKMSTVMIHTKKSCSDSCTIQRASVLLGRFTYRTGVEKIIWLITVNQAQQHCNYSVM